MHFIQKIILYLVTILALLSCSQKKVIYIHGVNNLHTKLANLTINKNNKNDVLNILGPSIIMTNNNKVWTYYEVREEKNILGKIILLRNNVAILSFSNYGILENITFFNKKDMNELDFDDNITKTTGVNNSMIKNILKSTKKRFLNKKKSLKSSEQ